MVRAFVNEGDMIADVGSGCGQELELELELEPEPKPKPKPKRWVGRRRGEGAPRVGWRDTP